MGWPRPQQRSHPRRRARLGLFAAASSARWLAVFFISVNAVAQIVWFPAAPLWAMMMIFLDVVVIYQLTARWEE